MASTVKIQDIRDVLEYWNERLMEEYPDYINGYGDNAPLCIDQAYGGYAVDLVIPGGTGHSEIVGRGTKRHVMNNLWGSTYDYASEKLGRYMEYYRKYPERANM